MRLSRRAIDTNAMDWQPLSSELSCKLLNGKPEEGPHTMLLRSVPRARGRSFGQYHPVDEEFFCLQGDFTFDGSTWFRDGSYAFYPAYFVHGTKVHVRGGYMVYLRLSGSSELFTVDEPISDTPYYVGDGQPVNHALQLVDTAGLEVASRDGGGGSPQVRQLRADNTTGAGSTLLTATRSSGQIIELETRGLLEIFTISGSFLLADGGSLHTHTYHCEMGDCPRIALQCSEPGSLQISHGGDLAVKVAGSIISTKGSN